MSDLQPFLPTRKRPMKLNTLVTLMVCAIIASVLLVVFALYSVQITRATRDDVKDTALGIARTLANSPEIQRGLMQAPQENIIQPIAQAVTRILFSASGSITRTVTDRMSLITRFGKITRFFCVSAIYLARSSPSRRTRLA